MAGNQIIEVPSEKNLMGYLTKPSATYIQYGPIRFLHQQRSQLVASHTARRSLTEKAIREEGKASGGALGFSFNKGMSSSSDKTANNLACKEISLCHK